MKQVALIYARLSHTRDDNQTSVDEQVRQCVERVAQRGWLCDPHRDVYREEKGHRSGRSLASRRAMKALMDRVRWDSSVAAVLVYELPRAARDTEWFLGFLKLLKRANIEFVSLLDPDVNTDTAAGMFVTTIKSGMAQYYADYGSERVRAYYQLGRRNNWITTRKAPLGLRLIGSKESRHYEQDDEWPVALSVIEQLANGDSFIRTAQDLSTRGVRVRDHAGELVPLRMWHVRHVAERLELYKPFLPSQLYNAAVRRVQERSQRRLNANQPESIRVLWKLLRCAACGAPFYVFDLATRKGHGASRSYRHVRESNCPNRRAISAHKLERQVWPVLERLSHFIADHESDARRMLTPPQEEKHDANAEKRKTLERRLENLERAYIAEEIRRESYLPLKLEIENALSEIPKEEKRPAPRVISFEEVRDAVSRITSADFEFIARQDAQGVNRVLRDFFQQITVDRDNSLRFQPHPELIELCRAAGIPVI